MKSILLIEDDPFLANIYETELKSSGFSVEVAADGREGLRKIKEKKFDLAILDILLPYVDGWEILKRIREDKIDTKAIILSNLAEKEDIEKSLKLKANKYLIKTHYTPSEVVEEIKEVLGVQRLLDK